jgi:NodT family efflux transporter outer membrane factor (OMF) lipoprotein
LRRDAPLRPIPGRRATLLSAGALLAGCTLGIDTPEAGIAAPARFTMAQGDGTVPPPDPAWWRAFSAPQLDALMQAAMGRNLDIAAAIAQLRQADAQVRIAGAALLPTLDADGSAGRNRSGNPFNPGSAGTARNSFGAGLSASYEIDFWGRNRALRESARSSAAAAAYNVGVVTLTTQRTIATTFFAVLGAQEELVIQQGNLDLATRTLAILRDRLTAGTATGLDTAQQETVVAQQRAAIPPLRQTVEQNSFALATLTGVTPDQISIAALRLGAVRMPAIAAGLPSALLLRRPDVRFAEANLAAGAANVTAARAALFPTITLTGSGGLQSLALESLLRPGSVIYNLAAGITAPIFDGGLLRGQLDQSRARQEELLANYRRAILAALEDTESNLSAFQRGSELVRLRAVQEAAARRAYTIADSQLRAGTIDLLTVLSTQQSLFSARDALAQAQTQQLQAAATLFTALGGGWTATASAASAQRDTAP